jgi:dCMP deaminase
MDMALRVAEMSYAVRKKVGSVLVKDDNIISFGWNGMPAGWDNNCEYKDYDISRDFNGNYFPYSEKEYPLEDERGRYRLKTNPEVLHSEANTILKIARSTVSSEGATLFTTLAPCSDCAKLIYQSGIKKVYYRDSYREKTGVEFLEKSGVIVEQLP